MQSGGALPMSSRARMQREYGLLQGGNGLGGVLRRLFRSAIPFLIRGGKEIGRQALKTGINFGEDVLAGKNVKTATKNRLAETVGDVVKKANSKIQSGAGTKRKAKPDHLLSAFAVRDQRGKYYRSFERPEVRNRKMYQSRFRHHNPLTCIQAGYVESSQLSRYTPPSNLGYMLFQTNAVFC